MALVGDRERERTAASLRRHFVQGRLTVEELGARAELALRARSQSELQAAVRDLPWQWPAPPSELVESGARAVRRGARVGVFVLLATVWAWASLVLAIGLGVAVLVSGASFAVFAVFAILWGAMTVVVWRTWSRARRRFSR